MSWENEPHYLGAFKMNLPGQYEYQRRIFSQFMQGIEDNAPYGFILAGDDVSDGRVGRRGRDHSDQRVHKAAVLFGGGSQTGNPGPIDAWDTLKPIVRS